MTTKKTQPAPIPLTLDRLALAGAVLLYADPPSGAFIMYDAPKEPTDRCLRLAAIGADITVEVQVPFADAKAHTVAGAILDVTAWKQFDGFQTRTEKATLTRTSRGVKVESAPLGKRGVSIAAVQTTLTCVKPPGDTDDVTEQTYSEFVAKTEAALDNGEVPGSMMAVLSMLSMLRPAAVKTSVFPGAVEYSGAARAGLFFRITVTRP